MVYCHFLQASRELMEKENPLADRLKGLHISGSSHTDLHDAVESMPVKAERGTHPSLL